VNGFEQVHGMCNAAMADLFDRIKRLCKRKRRHSTLDYKLPPWFPKNRISVGLDEKLVA